MLARKEMMDHLVCLETMDPLGYQEFLEKWDQGVSLAQEDSMDCLDLLAFLDQKVLQDLKEMRGQQDHQGLLDRLVTKVLWDLLAL